VLRYEETAREKALAVLNVLRSREMAKARARWLKEALERSTMVQPKGKPASALFKVLVADLAVKMWTRGRLVA